MNKSDLKDMYTESLRHLESELLPFWLDRCRDSLNGGFITHFDKEGKDTGEDQKSLIAQTRTVYSMSLAHRHGYGQGKCGEYAAHGVNFLIDTMWDPEYGGFFWTVNRAGRVEIDKKILYGHDFAMYALSEYTLATGDPRGREYAEKVFDLLQKYAADTMYGGYFEMFNRDWSLSGPGSGGGDRKTLDAHMHLMEALTSLYEVTGKEIHRRKLLESIHLLIKRMLHEKYGTGVPQFTPDWAVAPQIKFDIVWGWDRFSEDNAKPNAFDNTSYGHNVEFAWLLDRALDLIGVDKQDYEPVLLRACYHAVDNGIDREYGGVYVEGSHEGEVYDREKEFWQQAELMIGMLHAYLHFGDARFLEVYVNVHRFVMDKMIHHPVGEWFPLLTREGEPIWTHMSHSWKVNYHSIRCMVMTIAALQKILEDNDLPW